MRLVDIREEATATAKVDVDDPQRGQWGGKAAANGRELRASVKTKDEGHWFKIKLEVSSTNNSPLVGAVDFHLHPTFVPARRRVEADGNRAMLTIFAYGAFTVGVRADQGETRLELNLAKLRTAPREFRTH